MQKEASLFYPAQDEKIKVVNAQGGPACLAQTRSDRPGKTGMDRPATQDIILRYNLPAVS
jgi:hypothetical protein